MKFKSIKAFYIPMYRENAMSFKTFFKTLPKSLLLGILIATIIYSFDGVVLSSVVSNVTFFNRHTPAKKAVLYIISSLLALGLVYFAMTLKQIWINQAIKLMNIKIKDSFVYGQIVNPDFAAVASDNVSKIFNDFKLIETNYFKNFFELCGAILMAAISSFYILWLNFAIGILFILFSLLPMLSSKIFGKVLSDSSETWQKSSSTYLGKVTDLFNGIRTIKTYLAEKAMFADTENYLQQTENSYKKMNDYQAWAIFLSAILSALSFILPLGAGLFFVINGQAEPAAIIAIFLASDRVVGPLRNAAQCLNEMKTTENIRKSLKLYPLEFAENKNSNLNSPSIKIDDVSFAYNDKKVILTNLSLTIPFRTKILITGKSGAGKSTIFNLIEGFIKPTSGQIFLQDGSQVVKNIAGSGELAYIAQSPFMFNDTLRLNLTLGKEFSDEECVKALKAVGLLAELGDNCLDKKYGENGANLSGGQKQRIEIARALIYRKKIILVDEATSALDNETGKKVQQVINRLNCTVLEIAHHYDEQIFKDNNFKHYELKDNTLLERNN